MKQRLLIFLSLLLFVPAVFARTYSLKDVPNVQLSDASRYTSNPDGILSEGAVMAIDKACDSLHNIGRAQVAVVVVEDIDSDDVFTFAHSLFSSWGVGGRESDNGLGIILVTQKREIRFVTGYGLEGVLTDAMCKRIQQRYMVSHLSKGDYDTGMVEGVAAVAHIISQSGEIDLEQDETDVELLWFMAVFMVFIILIIVVAVVVEWYSRKCPKCGKHHLKMQSSSILSSTKKYDVIEKRFCCTSCGFVCAKRETIYKPTTTVYVGGRGGGFGGGGFGGGFGGGSFGGGGAGSRF